jgi:hypothetical protein
MAGAVPSDTPQGGTKAGAFDAPSPRRASRADARDRACGAGLRDALRCGQPEASREARGAHSGDPHRPRRMIGGGGPPTSPVRLRPTGGGVTFRVAWYRRGAFPGARRMQAPSALGAVSAGVLAGNVVQHQTPRVQQAFLGNARGVFLVFSGTDRPSLTERGTASTRRTVDRSDIVHARNHAAEQRLACFQQRRVRSHALW